MVSDDIQIQDAPMIAGLVFRHFRGASDYPHMAAVIALSAEADHIERADSAEAIAQNHQYLSNCDPYQDMLFVEIDGEVIGYERGWWGEESEDVRIYTQVGFLAPAWRRKGIGSAMLRWLEERQRQIAQGHPTGQTRFFQQFASQYETGKIALLEAGGYQPVRYFYGMVRPTLEDIPDFPLPPGVEVRPAQPEHYPAIWTSIEEISVDEWGYQKLTETDYQAWQADKSHFQPELWQIAWEPASQRVVGHVLTFIDYSENEKYQRMRGYTEDIGVVRAWRKKGLARALIARSLRAQKEAGMLESALGVDSENPSGATRLYEACGFQVARRDAIYRKAF
jgi:GNAT superfamily N-acetyltransferase